MAAAAAWNVVGRVFMTSLRMKMKVFFMQCMIIPTVMYVRGGNSVVFLNGTRK